MRSVASSATMQQGVGVTRELSGGEANEGELTEGASDEETGAMQKRRSEGRVEKAGHVDDATVLLPGLQNGRWQRGWRRRRSGRSSIAEARSQRSYRGRSVGKSVRGLHGVSGGTGR